MVASRPNPKDPYTWNNKRALDEEKHILCLGVLPFQDKGDGTCGTNSWMPVKDLVRSCMLESAGDEPNVQIRSGNSDQFLPWAFVTLKKKENAKRVYDQIAGNTWYGNVMMVVWLFFSLKPRGIRLMSIGSELQDPKDLGKYSQIRDKRLLCPNSYENSKRSAGEQSQDTLQLVKNIITNIESMNPDDKPITTQMPLSIPVYPTAPLQPWMAPGMSNQAYPNHNGIPPNQLNNYWVYPNSNTVPDMNPMLPAGGPFLPPYAVPHVTMAPMVPVPHNNGGLVNSAGRIKTNPIAPYNQTKPTRTNRYPNVSHGQPKLTKNNGNSSTRPMSRRNSIKNEAVSTTTSKKVAYTPPVIVGGDWRPSSSKKS